MVEHFERFEETLTSQCDFNGVAVGKAPRLGQTLCVPKDVGPSRFLRFLRHFSHSVLISASDDEIVCTLPNTAQEVAPVQPHQAHAAPTNGSTVFW